MRRVCSAIVLAIAFAARPDAITVVPMTFEELVREATAVVYARVADVDGRWTADRRSIESHIRLEALDYLKGDLGPSVTMRLPGGSAGGQMQVLPGAPVLREGDLVVLFLGARGPTIPSVVGLTQGVFRVSVHAETGAVTVAPPPLKSSAVGRVVRGAGSRRPLALEVLAREVRGVIEAQP